MVSGAIGGGVNGLKAACGRSGAVRWYILSGVQYNKLFSGINGGGLND